MREQSLCSKPIERESQSDFSGAGRRHFPFLFFSLQPMRRQDSGSPVPFQHGHPRVLRITMIYNPAEPN